LPIGTQKLIEKYHDGNPAVVVSLRFLERIDMKLIELLLTALCAAVGIGALSVGNYLEATVICMLPIGYFAVTKARAIRAQRKAEQAKRQEEADRFWAKERELRKKPQEEYTFDRWNAVTSREQQEMEQRRLFEQHRA
jgi:hypothetical protein